MIESLEKKAVEAAEAENKYAEAKKESEDRARRAEEAEAKAEQMQEALNRWERTFTFCVESLWSVFPICTTLVKTNESHGSCRGSLF